jgi:enoyl-CoA hydratase
MNTADHGFVTRLSAVLEQIDADLSIRVVILTGQGRAFCAGLNLDGYGDDELIAEQGALPRALARQKEIAALVAQLRGLRVPVVAAVNGAVAGVGLSLLCAADIRCAVPEATMAVGYIRAGFSACDMGLSWMLPRIIGVARAQELMLTGRRFTPTEAQSAGLLADVVPADRLQDRALEYARQILTNAPISVELTKEGLWKALEFPSFEAAVEFENRQQVYTAMTDDRQEATASFLEKREPRYSRR